MSVTLRFGLFLVMWLTPLMVHAQSQSPASSSGHVANEEYFPSGIFSELPQRDHFRANWFGQTLSALSEPSLFELRTDKGAQVYRFLWLPSFHRPISVRLAIRPDGSGSVIARSVDKHAGLLTKEKRDSGKLVLDTASIVSKAEVQEVLNQLQSLKFWSMTTKEDSTGMDGAEWVLEGVKGGEYHVVDRWSPELYENRAASNKEFAILCRSFLKLAGVEVKDLY